MKKGRKGVSLLLTAMMVAGLFAGCGNTGTETGGDGKTTSVTLNEVAHSIFYAPMYVAIEEGYFKEEGLDVILVTGFGADKTMTAVLTGEADIGFMGSESTIYTYAGGTDDYVVNFAQLTQRAGNFLVSREPIDEFSWDMLKGQDVLGGRAGGMPQMVFEYILRKNNIDPAADLRIDQSIDFGRLCGGFPGRGFRLCAIHRFQCQEELHRKERQCDPGVHQRSAKGYGLCAVPQSGGNRRCDCSPVCRDRQAGSGDHRGQIL